ncbi:GNAT family N-acetyltransferase, partial [Rhizobium ruizarguesonis]
LFASLNDLKAMGYAYAIIGAVGPSAFYEKAVGAVPIPNSAPGIYAGMLKS